MPAWDQLVREFQSAPDRDAWLDSKLKATLRALAKHRDRNVVFYGSAFLQKPTVPAWMTMIMTEDINGFMSTIYGMDCSKGLDLVLHTPGGNPNAAEQIVAYLRSKFEEITVIVPTLAMSAGTMISLAADDIIMGRQSQLGPIDPQFGIGQRTMSAREIVEQFDRAKEEILANPELDRVWAPITQSLGPALLHNAQNALDYSEQMVARWLERWMFAGEANAREHGEQVAKHFNDATTHKSHGRRIDSAEVASFGVKVAALEAEQLLQETVLTLYHVMTMVFEMTPTTKILAASTGRRWMKNLPKAPAPAP